MIFYQCESCGTCSEDELYIQEHSKRTGHDYNEAKDTDPRAIYWGVA